MSLLSKLRIKQLKTPGPSSWKLGRFGEKREGSEQVMLAYSKWLHILPLIEMSLRNVSPTLAIWSILVLIVILLTILFPKFG